MHTSKLGSGNQHQRIYYIQTTHSNHKFNVVVHLA